MKKNVWSQVLSSGLISLTLLAGCQFSPEPPAVAEPTDPVLSEVETPSTVDPADRKFLTPGYGVNASRYEETEALPTIDPADRKFFTPGYGVNAAENDLSAYHESEWNRSPHTGLGVKALPTIDPADRKFFTPGYGVNAAENDLTAYHQSEWDRTSNTALDVEENALAVYHQSEWSRTPNPVLDVEALSKIDPADRKFFIPGYGAYATPKE